MDARIWFTMTLFEQLSNIDGEVKRLIDDHERMLKGQITNDYSFDYIKKIVSLIDLTFKDPKNLDKIMAQKELFDEVEEIIRYLNEYSGAAEPPFRKIGNRESGAGNRHTAIVTFASLLA